MSFRKLKVALITVGVATLGMATLGVIYLKRNKVQIAIKTADWSYETPDIVPEPTDFPN